MQCGSVIHNFNPRYCVHHFFFVCDRSEGSRERTVLNVDTNNVVTFVSVGSRKRFAKMAGAASHQYPNDAHLH
jgi:hypothetical protein